MRGTVSVVIPTFNRAAVVCEALASVLQQTHGDLQVLVVDDGSTDDTAARVRPFLKDARVRYLRADHRGPGAARNVGIAASCGDLVSFLDSDDLWRPGKLERDIAFLDRYAEVHAVFSDLEKYDGGVYTPSFVRECSTFFRMISDLPLGGSIAFSGPEMHRCLLQEIPVKTSTFTCRRPCIEMLGGFREDLVSAEDWELFLRLSKQYRLGYVNEVLVTVRVRADSLHRETAVTGSLAAWEFLADELRGNWKERDVAAAARAGIGLLSRHLGWHYLARRDWKSAMRVHIRGFLEARESGLLLRAVMDVFSPLRSSRIWREGRGSVVRAMGSGDAKR
jgi:glycosyltransferase involved in cell wall biosynthesis